MKESNIYPFFLSRRGCDRLCVYCCQELHVDGARKWSPEAVACELDRWLPATAGGEIAFYGGSFTLLPTQEQVAFLNVATGYVAAGRASGIRLSTHPVGLRQNHLDLLAQFPVTTVEVGCQSFSDPVLRRSGRGHSAREIVDGAGRLRRLGVRLGLQLMPGLPGAGRDEALESLEAALFLTPDFLRIYPTVVLPGTPLAQMLAMGEYRAWSLDEAVDVVADMLTRCRQVAVPVIRMGIPPLDCAPLAGPYHQAFGQLVKSKLWKRALSMALELVGTFDVKVPPQFLSDAMGHKKTNLSQLRESHGLQTIRPDVGLEGEEFLLGSTLFPLVHEKAVTGGRHVS